MSKLKGISAIAVIVVLGLVVAGAVVTSYYLTTGAAVGGGAPPSKLTTVAARLAGVSEPAGGKNIPSIDYEVNTVAGDPAQQDSQADIDIDAFEFPTDASGGYTKNAELVSKNLADCTGTIPAVYDGVNGQIELVDKNYCKPNVYKFWRDSNFNGGNSETTDFQLVLGSAVASDLDDIDDTGGTEEFRASVDKIYLITVTEVATGDDEDVIPHIFLIGSVKTSNLDVTEFANGNVNIRFTDKYNSDAGAGSKTRLSGECKDDTSSKNTVSLDSSLNGAIHSSITTADTIQLNCEVWLDITQDGYSMVLVNPLAASNTEKSYLVVYPYGETDSAVGGEHLPYGVGNLTGDVAYNAGNVTSKQIFYQGMTACGETITQNSGSDAVVKGSDNMYEPSCFTSSSTTLKGIVGLHNKGARLTIPIFINEVQVDDDAGSLGWDATWSGIEHIANLSLVTVESATDRINANITG